MAEDTNGWSRSELFVREKLDEHSNKLDHIDDRLRTMAEDIIALKVKAGMWGLMGGAIPVALLLIKELLSK